MTAYYNEIDPYAAQWLRNLIAAGHIAPGVVDERDIRDVVPSDLFGFTQCHFFAGIGVWSYALRRAGWPDDRPVWTGSCPCQPFSAAGAGKGIADERHLWPHWHHLIRVCRPPNVFGEQVASKDGLGWLDLVQADMEGENYACWPVDLCAAGVGAPHIRQRLWFTGVGELADRDRVLLDGRWHQWPRRWLELADGGIADRLDHADDAGSQGHAGNGDALGGWSRAVGPVAEASLPSWMADLVGERRQRGPDASGPDGENATQWREGPSDAERDRFYGELADDTGRGQRVGGGALVPRDVRHADGSGDPFGFLVDSDQSDESAERQQRGRELGGAGEAERAGAAVRGSAGSVEHPDRGPVPVALGGPQERDGQRPDRADADAGAGRPGPTNGPWGVADWPLCRDGKWRPVEPGTFPLAHGATSRVGRLRAYGNAIVAEAAEAVIKVYLDHEHDAAADRGDLLNTEDLLG